MQKKLYFTAPGKAELKNELIPDLEIGECLIKNTASLISPGTELALFTGKHVGFTDPEISWARYPIAPGYAVMGEIVRCNNGKVLQEGEKILYYGLHSSYGTINPDTEIWAKVPENLSEESLFGRFAQISSTVPFLIERGTKEGNMLVFGAGLIGNFCAQLLKTKRDKKVIIADLSEKRLALASKCGIQYRINTSRENIAESIQSITENEGIDIVVEATGVPELVSQSLHLVNPMGFVYLLGSSRGEVCINAYKMIHRKGTSLIGAHESVINRTGSSDLNNPVQDQLNEMLSSLSKGVLKTDGMITNRISPEQAQEYYNHLLNDPDNYLGIIIHWE